MTMKLTLPRNSKMLTPEFCYGVATASFQIEGGINHRQTNIWDTFCAKPGTISDKSNGETACDHFNLWQQDIELIAALGVDAYRFSIAWGRVLNEDGSVNPEGIAFYKQILNKLNSLNIKAYVTLYHWDLPQHIEDEGGWLNRKTAYLFADYVEKVSNALGDGVYSYATLNEPFCSAYLGYEVGIHAPGLKSKDYGKKAAHHLLLAHGLAIKVLSKTSPNSQNGIVLNFTPAYSTSENQHDIAAAKLADDHFNHWYIKAVIDGAYPDLLNQLPASQKPDIHVGDMEIISTAIDFLGINYYTREVYAHNDEEQFETVNQVDADKTDMGWEIFPQGLTNLLVSYNQIYKLPPLFITENGAAMPDKIVDGKVHDKKRIEYFNSHLNAVNDAIEQGVDIRGYFAWSLMDNFEWALGYEKRFGIVYVDYNNQQRTIKDSGYAYQQLLSERTNSNNRHCA